MKTLELHLDSLSDDVLLARVAEMVGRSRRVEADLVWHLAEVDRRRLYLREACPSMHVYATTRLHLSDAEAYLRITAARPSRRFPAVLAMLAEGMLHLSAIAKLAPHLREDNAETLLGRAARRSKREIDMLVAELAPQPDVPSRMRRLPDTPAATTVGAAELRPDGVCIREVADAPATASVVDRTDAMDTRGHSVVACSGAQTTGADQRRVPVASPAIIAPLAPARYKVQFTAGPELHDKIERARALLRHQIPDGDLGAVFDRAMTLLVGELERARFAATKAPRKAVEDVDPTPASRRIPDPIKREVWMRDEERCTFRDRMGRRCPARERLEFHHVVPFAQGGDHSASNVTLRCSGTTPIRPTSTSGRASWPPPGAAVGLVNDRVATAGGRRAGGPVLASGSGDSGVLAAMRGPAALAAMPAVLSRGDVRPRSPPCPPRFRAAMWDRALARPSWPISTPAGRIGSPRPGPRARALAALTRARARGESARAGGT